MERGERYVRTRTRSTVAPASGPSAVPEADIAPATDVFVTLEESASLPAVRAALEGVGLFQPQSSICCRAYSGEVVAMRISQAAPAGARWFSVGQKTVLRLLPAPRPAPPVQPSDREVGRQQPHLSHLAALWRAIATALPQSLLGAHIDGAHVHFPTDSPTLLHAPQVHTPVRWPSPPGEGLWSSAAETRA